MIFRRIFTVILGLVVIFLGVLPLLETANALPRFLESVPRSGIWYQIFLIIVGILIIVASSRGRLRRFMLR